METGRCAAISDSFFQTAPPTYAVPFSVTGTKAPNQGSELTICQSTTYKYTANFRFNNKECGEWQRVTGWPWKKHHRSTMHAIHLFVL